MPYVSRPPLNEYERRVRAAGYHWVDTVDLRPNGTGDEFDGRNMVFDRLNPHLHRSRNTHLIISGHLEIFQTHRRENVQNNPRLFGTMDANNDDPKQKELPVWNDTQYKGRTGVSGATFVEGHTILSPGTAERFERRGAITWVDDDSGMTREEWLAQHRAEKMREGVHTNWVDQNGLY